MPVDSAQKLTLKIHDLSRGGAGVARDTTGRVVFVPYTLPGDQVQVEVLKETAHYAHAQCVELLKPSPQRQSPPCPVFGVCGGCQWQHVPYELQWSTKLQGVQDVLRKNQIPLDLLQLESIPASQVWGYRNRIQLHLQGKDIGFFAPQSHIVVPIERCEIARPEINAVFEQLRKEYEALAFEPKKVEIEVSQTGQVAISWDAPHAALGFRQIHDEQNEKLKNWVSSVLPRSEILYDLFGGSGNLSLSLADRMQIIHCVDVSIPQKKQPVTPSNFHFHSAPVLQWLKSQVSFYAAAGARKPLSATAFLDPPRGGLGKDLDEIAFLLERLHVHHMVVIGCHSDAWGRDLKAWSKRGWKLEKVAAIDLFPQTVHLECLALLAL